MTPDQITIEQIRHAIQVHELGPSGLADLLCPGLNRADRQRFAKRIKGIAQRDRRKHRAPTPPVPFTKPSLSTSSASSPITNAGELTRDEFLRQRIQEIEGDIDMAREMGHTNALTNLMREQRTCVTELDELTKTQEPADEFEGMHGMELIQPICDALRDPDFPEVIAEAIADSLRDRYGGNVVPFKSRQ